MPIGPLGEVGLLNSGGLPKLTLPVALSGCIWSLPVAPVRGPVREVGLTGVPVASAWLSLQPGQALSIPVVILGALGLEVV